MTPQRLGPTRAGSPLLKVWQAAHFLAIASPTEASALANKAAGSGAGFPAGAAGAVSLAGTVAGAAARIGKAFCVSFAGRTRSAATRFAIVPGLSAAWLAAALLA